MKVIFWGPLGLIKDGVVGGGEAGNHKTIFFLQQCGFSVRCVGKPYPDKLRDKLGIVYFFSLLKSCCKVFLHGIADRPAIIYVSAFGMHLLFFEFIIFIISKFLGIKFVYEVRGGAYENEFNRRTCIYQFFSRMILRNADLVAVQVPKVYRFVQSLGVKFPLYYPNYIMSSQYSCSFRKIKQEVINVIYFGRIVESKGVEIALDVINILLEKKCKVEFLLVGSIEDNYFHILDNKITTRGINASVKIIPPLSFNELVVMISRSQFFLFPTKNKIEGHSNSLLEAMAFGVIPLCSDQCHNRDFVPMQIPVFSSVEQYAEYIIALSNDKNKYEFLSKICIDFVNYNFTDNIIFSRFRDAMQRIVQ